MQRLFKAAPKFIIAHEQKLVIVFQEVIPASTNKPVYCPDARRASKRVQIAHVLTVLGYFEICESLGFGHEDNVDVAVICAEVGLAFNCAAQNTAFCHLKNAPQLGGKHTADYETVAL